MARKSGFVRRHGSMRRESLWVPLTFSQDTLAAASTVVLISVAGAGLLALRPFTIVRTRGLVMVRSDQNAVSEDQELGYGHAIVSEQASAIGVTAIPTPVTDMDSDLWFVYESLVQRLTFADATGFNPTAGEVRYFDSKAMRKVEDGQDIVTVAETGATSEGVLMTSTFRFLIKLH